MEVLTIKCYSVNARLGNQFPLCGSNLAGSMTNSILR